MKKKRNRRDAGEMLMDRVRPYLLSQGWDALVGGPITIEQMPYARKGCFRLVIEFVGGKKKEDVHEREAVSA